ncbi:DinB family protein [Winogradskyella sp. UBA3174]|uniref:DinB family protein n=1 Tax=Winogradskyella sp. UBA3174 TaxID=1947785 RepID=UPI0025F27F29|nr:DinB family protein [Winogradskyella sp. UBA3174]|tara:strand:- start:35916 stop:36518 length:603 start_codon:yes stop_codon:yes gene_type:complete
MKSKIQELIKNIINSVIKNQIQIFLLLIFSSSSLSYAQNEIKPLKGYSNDIGNMISMLDNLKQRVERHVKNLDQAGTDFLLDENSNSPGAMIYHLAATEAYYQVYTFEGRGFNAEEKAKWETALSLGEKARDEFKNKPIKYYMGLYDEVREKTKKLLKSKDDDWFKSKKGNVSMHWAWFHVMEHQANHMGQLALITKRIN